jgi:hypothetical protein
VGWAFGQDGGIIRAIGDRSVAPGNWLIGLGDKWQNRLPSLAPPGMRARWSGSAR